MENVNVKVKNPVIKEYFVKEDCNTSKELGALFGQSERELKKEFGSYKAKKIYNKFCAHIDSRDMLVQEVKNLVKESANYGFYGVNVYPTAVKMAKTVSPCNVKVRALVSWPFGEDDIKTIKYSVKQAVKNGADEIVFPLSCYKFRSDDKEIYKKEIASVIKSAKKRLAFIALDVSVLTLPEIETAIKTFEDIIGGIALYSKSGLVSKETLLAIKTDKHPKTRFDVLSKVSESEDAVSLLITGVNTLSLENPIDIAKDLSLKIERAQDVETLDKS